METDRQTDKLTNATKNITSFAKEVMTKLTPFGCFLKGYTHNGGCDYGGGQLWRGNYGGQLWRGDYGGATMEGRLWRGDYEGRLWRATMEGDYGGVTMEG